jgi:hypothetical protein
MCDCKEKKKVTGDILGVITQTSLSLVAMEIEMGKEINVGETFKSHFNKNMKLISQYVECEAD